MEVDSGSKEKCVCSASHGAPGPVRRKTTVARPRRSKTNRFGDGSLHAFHVTMTTARDLSALSDIRAPARSKRNPEVTGHTFAHCLRSNRARVSAAFTTVPNPCVSRANSFRAAT